MSDRLLVATRKGLFEIRRKDHEVWSVARASFLGSPVTYALRDPRDGAQYAALDLGRQRRRRDELNAVATERAVQDGGATPDHLDPGREAEETDLRRALAEALVLLPEAQRRTFVLHVDGGLSYREVAAAMEISIGTVMSRLFYARQKLKGILAARVQP